MKYKLEAFLFVFLHIRLTTYTPPIRSNSFMVLHTRCLDHPSSFEILAYEGNISPFPLYPDRYKYSILQLADIFGLRMNELYTVING